MIKLKNEIAFAHGNHRAVYRHPSNPARCLKFLNEDLSENNRWQKASWLSKLFRPKRYYQDNDAELHFSKQVRKRIGDKISTFIAEAHGYVDSDLGPLLEVDLIRDHDGEISLSLKEYVYTKGMTPECQIALDSFWDKIEKTWTFVHGRPDNLSVSQADDGTCQLYAIDGYAFGQFIPLAKWFRKDQKRLLRKRKRNQAAAIQKIIDAKHHGGEITNNGFLNPPNPPNPQKEE